jgi:hypothetical protein
MATTIRRNSNGRKESSSKKGRREAGREASREESRREEAGSETSRETSRKESSCEASREEAGSEKGRRKEVVVQQTSNLVESNAVQVPMIFIGTPCAAFLFIVAVFPC